MIHCPTYQSFEIDSTASFEPITLAEAKMHLRVDHDDEDDYINALIQAARVSCENYTEQHFVQKTIKEYHDDFPSTIYLRVPNVSSLTSIKYQDAESVEQTFASSKYEADLKSFTARVTPVSTESWPSAKDIFNAVTIEYLAGYTSADNVPMPVKQAMKLIIAKWYEYREDNLGRQNSKSLPSTAEALLNQYRVWVL